MSPRDIIRAWKDELFRKSLSSDEQMLLPEHPAGEIVLTTKEIATVNGGAVTFTQPVQVCDPTSTTVPLGKMM